MKLHYFYFTWIIFIIPFYFFSQTQWRRVQALSNYKQQKRATVALQCLWRAKVARKELRKLRMVSLTTMDHFLEFNSNSFKISIKKKDNVSKVRGMVTVLSCCVGCKGNWGT